MPSPGSLFLLRTAAVSLCFVFALSVVQADDQVFVRGSEKAMRGTLGKVSKVEIELKPRTGKVTKIPADEIQRIRFDKEPAKLNLARNNERSGLLERALASYQEEFAKLKGAAKADTSFLIARTQAKIALTDPSKIDAALALMDRQLATNANGFRYFECLDWLGQLRVAKSDYEGAMKEFGKLGTSPLKSYQMTAKIARGRVLLAQNKPGEAQSSFSEVEGMQAEGAAQTAARYEAILGKATCLQLQGNFPDAIKSLDQVITNTKPDEDSQLHARAFLQKGHCYRDGKQPKLAILEYLKVDLIYNREKREHAASLFNLAQLWPSAGRPERGNEAATRMRQLYPNNEWTKKLGGG